MSAKRKLVLALISIAFVVLGLVATVSLVFALTQQTIISSLNIDYTVVDIDGSVEASYTLGETEVYLTPEGANTEGNKLIFKAEDTDNAGSLKFPSEKIILNEENNYTLLIKYTYTNTGDRHYIASMDFNSLSSNNNMIVEYGIQDSSMEEIQFSTDRYAVVVPAGSTGKSYWIKITVDDIAYDASFSAKLDWLLEGCDPQDKEYLSLESLNFTGDETSSTYSATYAGGYIPNGELIFPSEINGYEVTSISANTSLTTEKTLIKSVTIPESVTAIEDNAFDGFSNLEQVVFEQNTNAEVVSVQSTTGLTTIGNSAFANCNKLDNLDIPSTVTSISANAFENCFNIKEIVIPNGVQSLNEAMFKNCSSLVSVEMYENIVDFPEEIFSGCSELVDFEFPKNIETIGVSAFKDCSRIVGEVDLSCATNVGESAFENCSSLTKVTIGENITTLANNIFAGCENVEKYYLLSHNAITTLSDANVLKNINDDCKIYVIETLLSEYSADEYWSTYADKFAEIGFTTTGECLDTLEAPVLGLKIYGNSVQNGTPTPETPVEIQSVGDKTVNLFDVSKVKNSSGIINENGVLTVSKYGKSAGTLSELCPELEVGQTVTLSAVTDGLGYVHIGKLWNFGTSITITEQDLSSHVSFYNKSYGGDPATIYNIQIEEGTKATAYEPYGYKVPVRIKGKNLFGNLQDKWVLTTGEVVYNSTAKITQYIPCKAGDKFTLAATFATENESSNIIIINFRNVNDESVGRYVAKKNTYLTLTATAPAGTAYVVAGHYIKVPTQIQFEKNSVATDYEPYNEIKNIYIDEPLRKVGNYADYINFKTGKVVRNVRNIKLNIANMNNSDTYPGWINMTILKQDYPNKNVTIQSLTSIISNIGASKGIAINTLSSGIVFFAKELWGLNQTEWKTNYPDLVFDLCYGLQTSYEQDVEIPEFNTISGNTTFEVLTSVQPSQIMVKYHK